MKKLETMSIGTIEYTEDSIITFNNGIPGFEDEKEFIIYKENDKSPFAYLLFINNSKLSLVIANPFYFFSDYEFELSGQVKEELGIEKIEDVDIWGIISVSKDFKQSTMNLKAPLIINNKKKKGKQYILHESNYLTKTPIFSQLEQERGK